MAHSIVILTTWEDQDGGRRLPPASATREFSDLLTVHFLLKSFSD